MVQLQSCRNRKIFIIVCVSKREKEIGGCD